MGEFVDVTSTGSFGLISGVFCTAALALYALFQPDEATMTISWRRLISDFRQTIKSRPDRS